MLLTLHGIRTYGWRNLYTNPKAGHKYAQTHPGHESLNFMEAWEKLKNIELNTDYSKIYTSPSIDELNQIANDWAQVISEYRSKLESEPEGEYSHIKKEMINVLVAVVEDFLGNLSKLTDYLSSIQNYDENLWKTLSSSGLPVSGSLLTGAGLLEKFSSLLKDYNEISVNTIKKWEDSFEKERLYWQEKITVKR